MSLANLKRAGIVGLFAALSFAAVVFLGTTRSVSDFQSAAAQDKKPADEINRLKNENPAALRETMNSRTLSTLLADQEINFNETSLLPNRVEGSRTITVRFRSAEKNLTANEFSERKPAANSLKQTSPQRAGDAGLSRQRAFEITPSQILIVSVDANKRVLWWDLQIDPRIFRAETADDSGALSGRTVYRHDAEMLVSVPAAEEIVELYFYSPNWDGQTYSLELIGKLNLLDDENAK